MGNSLQDQLLKAGAVSKKKAHQATKSKQKKTKLKQKQKVEDVNDTKIAAERAQREKAERDRQLNLQRKAEAEQKAVTAQIRQLIESNRLELGEGEIAYSFTDESKIKQLYVNESQQRQLGKGRLAIIKLDERFELVPTPVAEKISLRDKSYIIQINESQPQETDEDDPYAEFEIPDDLMW
ncbi:nucleoprotein/polynucleotide-associated enzyme [Solemya pervernicosa gill symbiont]|uniref:Nucleoprotein/polynucleotide-associated enzyme n=2 Tax=Gammaproteobacteria incertae sedis TaxID=118884 RepID=A0A1T2L8I3_9GAMM|nr:DUF2058 domain-containing protein [Candidatus Reidiella endopervernicosa]OOZ41428.1 nucleoprotein/polynucleotide-associated enzyme [Solemya pervernicosa gill symbiont]QKQ27533.1 DUF2058 domain-containing protein [Candidatus Reidiella endopervernicosa]